jgi:N-glycosylase/DNA lyase
MTEGAAQCSVRFTVRDYDLAATLNSGQAFRWKWVDNAWEGVVGRRWVRLRCRGTDSTTGGQGRGQSLEAQTAEPPPDWTWLAEYLQLGVDLDAVLRSFPDDLPLRQAVAACRGLRLLRQEPWECLASFLCSSTKQIVQIQQMVHLLSERFGEPVAVPAGHAPAWAFPTAQRLASCTEAELRACKLGFRAPHLLAAARAVAAGRIELDHLPRLGLEEARARLLALPGIGRKIADCVLLFACGFETAFPVDVWVARVLREFYFAGRPVPPRALLEFTASHFGPHAGYAQQYLFHFARLRARAVAADGIPTAPRPIEPASRPKGPGARTVRPSSPRLSTGPRRRLGPTTPAGGRAVGTVAAT